MSHHHTIQDSKSKMTLFGSLPFDIIPRVASTKQISQRFTSIQLEKLENEWATNAKRSSFLPSNFDHYEKAAAAEQQRNTSVTFQPGYFDDGEEEPLKLRKFCTGSRYIGQFNQLGMAGKGVYKYPHGVLYDGYFNKNGEFHGTGTLVYPGGQQIDGIWRNGKLVKASTSSSASQDNYQPKTQYCKMPDRRFKIEMESEVMPAGQEHLTNAEIPRKIPFGMYDTGNGYYNPQTHIVYDYNDPGKNKTVHEAHEEERTIIYKMILERTFSGEMIKNKMLRRVIPSATVIQMVPAEEYENWIKKHCRKAWDEPTGYLRAFYEAWTPGYKKDDQAITDKLLEISTAQQELAILQQVKEFLKQIKQPNYGSRIRGSTMFSFIVNNDQQFFHKYISGKSSLQSTETGRTSTRSTRSIRSYSHHVPRKSRKFDSPLLYGSPRSRSAPSSPSRGLKRSERSIGRLGEYPAKKQQQYKKVQC